MVVHQPDLHPILYVYPPIFSFLRDRLTLRFRVRTQSAGPRPYTARVLQPAAALARRLGRVLDVDLHTRQRLPGLLRVEHPKLPHGVHQHPHLLWSLDRLVSVHAHALLAQPRNGLCHGAFDVERWLFELAN